MALYYKFRQVDKYSLSALAGCQLWFDKLSNQNDPFEGSYRLNSELNDIEKEHVKRLFHPPTQELMEIFHTKFAAIRPENHSADELVSIYLRYLVQESAKRLQTSLICSMSNSDVGEHKHVKDPIDNTLMWGHYAGGLRGFCLVFDADKLTKSIFNNSRRLALPIPVTYSNVPAELKATDVVNISANGLEINESMSAIETLAKTSARKSWDWRGENEVRIISHGTEQLITYAPEALVCVVIGEKMPPTDRDLLQTVLAAKYPHVELQEAQVKNESYDLRFVPLS